MMMMVELMSVVENYSHACLMNGSAVTANWRQVDSMQESLRCVRIALGRILVGRPTKYEVKDK